jgi:hypothetical protein
VNCATIQNNVVDEKLFFYFASKPTDFACLQMLNKTSPHYADSDKQPLFMWLL